MLDQIQHITRRVKERLRELEQLKVQQQKQSELIQQLKEKNTALEEQIRVLEEQKNILISAAGKMPEADKAAFEATINKYIRDLDKCIALLSE